MSRARTSTELNAIPSTPSKRHCFRVGGVVSLLPGTGGWWQFKAIDAPQKIVLLRHFSDAEGGLARNPWNASWPLKTLSTATLAEQDGGTLVTMEWMPQESGDLELDTFLAGHSSMQPGWSSVLDRLEEHLSLLQSR